MWSVAVSPVCVRPPEIRLPSALIVAPLFCTCIWISVVEAFSVTCLRRMAVLARVKRPAPRPCLVHHVHNGRSFRISKKLPLAFVMAHWL